jgi:hypothetical protein
VEGARHLDSVLPSIAVQGRRVEVRRVTRPTELAGVHIFYVGAEMRARTRELRVAAMDQPILLVTDGDRGFGAGGAINFLEADRRVRFEVSLPAAERNRLRIDSALLQVAARVEREPQARLPGGQCFEDPCGAMPCLTSQATLGGRRES